MKPQLLKNFIIVCLFWFFATTLYWSLQQPEEILKNYQSLSGMFVKFGLSPLPDAKGGIFESMVLQARILKYWTVPIAALAAFSFIVGVALIAFWGVSRKKERDDRFSGQGEYRGVTLTVGVLPVPLKLKKVSIELDGDSRLDKLNPLHRAFLTEMLEIIAANPDTYPGEGISISWADHVLDLLDKALSHPKQPGLNALVVVGFELGKINAFFKDGYYTRPISKYEKIPLIGSVVSYIKDKQFVEPSFTWKEAPGKKQDKEAAKLISKLESWFKLPYEERMSILMAVKFRTTPSLVPIVDNNPQIYSLTRDLMNFSEATQTAIVKQEKQNTLEKTDLPEVVFEAFLKALPTLPFQSRGLPRGVSAAAYKIGNRVYLFEIKLRETVMAKLPDEVRGALTPGKEKQKIHPFTVELLKALRIKNWLVTAVDDVSLPTTEALWNIQAGSLPFKGIIIVEVPTEFMTQISGSDSVYDIQVLGPLFLSAAGSKDKPERNADKQDKSSADKDAGAKDNKDAKESKEKDAARGTSMSKEDLASILGPKPVNKKQ